MDVVLGVSVSATTVSMVLVEGEKADGVIIECATFDTANGVVKASPSEQISAAILATQRNAFSKGHHLVVSGVTWDDDPEPGTLSDGIAARDLQNVVLVAEQNAAGVLAQNVGRALGFDTTAVMVMGPETATLSVVDSDDGSIVEARMCTLDGEDVTDILPAMAATLETTNPKPGSVFVVGSRSAVCSVKSILENLISQPVIVPEDPEFALARGAALAAANVPGSEASTCGLAYSQDPDEFSALHQAPVKLADANTQAALLDSIGSDDVDASPHHRGDPRVRIPIVNVAAAIVVVGAVTLAMSVAGNVRSAVERASTPADVAEASALVPKRPVAQPAVAIPAPVVSAVQPPAPQSIPVAPPVAQPPPAPPLPAPVVPTRNPVVQVRQAAPQRVIAQPTPVAVEKPLEAAPVAVEPEVPDALPEPAAVEVPPLPVFTPPMPPASLPSPAIKAPAISPAAPWPPSSSSPWIPPWLSIGTPPSQQQAAQPVPDRQWVPTPLAPQQQVAQSPQQSSPGLQIDLWPRQQAPQQQWTPQVPQSTPAPSIPQWTPPLVPQSPPSPDPQWTPSLAPQSSPSVVPQWTPAPVLPQWTPAPVLPQWTPAPVLPQWTPAPVLPQWTPATSLQPPQYPATSRSLFPILR